MASSANRILATHVGSLVRPPQLVEFLHKTEDREPYDQSAYQNCLKESIETVVRQQADAGIDIVSYGEFSKGRNWAFYIHDRLTGLATRPLTPEEAKDPMAAVGGGQDRVAFPEFYAEYDRISGLNKRLGSRFVVTSALSYSDAQVKRDIANLKAAVAKTGVAGAFLPYMHEKMVPPMTHAQYREWAQLRIDALNHALKGIPPERSRYHICWGSWNGPHAFDVPMKDIVDLILQVNVGAYQFEAANPRHEHEWVVWRSVKLPAGKVLIPGVISHATNIVEHPELVAQRIVRLARIVGRENVMGGTDCGFAQSPFAQRVHPTIMWAKLKSLAEGARIATDELWGRRSAA